MSYKVIPTSQFEKDLKKLFKKYPSVKSGHYGHSFVPSRCIGTWERTQRALRKKLCELCALGGFYFCALSGFLFLNQVGSVNGEY